MLFLSSLWLPILASGIATWFASALCWMAIGHHRDDTKPVPNEKEFTDTIKRLGIPPGNYGFPDFKACQANSKGLPKEERKKKMQELWNAGPMGILRVWAPMNMGVNMFLTFLYFLLTSAVIGYLVWSAIGRGPHPFSHVMQITGTAAFLAYCFASFPNDLWFQKSRRAMLMNFLDGVLFALITGALFAWLWPR